MSDKKFVYDFAEGGARMKSLLGGKGANLAEMTSIGIPVPQGFIITTEACVHYSRAGEYPEGLAQEIEAHLAHLEEVTGKTLGDPSNPLLLSVRSGSVFSMPGMMDTILNLGLNDATVEGLVASTGNARFAYDSYRRFINMFGEVVMGVDAQLFEDALTEKKAELGVELDTDLSAEDLKDVTDRYKILLQKETGSTFPSDPREQLDLSVRAVFKSWDNQRAKVYRRLNNIPDDLGTAVNVQSMVFGNKGETSGTGVAFTRNPSDGSNEFYGEWLLNAQGEDVVAGVRHPRPLVELGEVMPDIYKELNDIRERLETHYRDMQDVEFTIEDGKLYMLQTRVGKRTAAAALQIAVDMVNSGMITKEEALARIEPEALDQLLHPNLDPKAKAEPLTSGLNASPGAATGKVVFTADAAAARGALGEKVVLVRWETNPDDIHGLVEAQGVITSHGGMTSHAAVVARGMGKPCIAGAADMKIDVVAKEITVGDVVIKEDDWITMDGSTGKVYLGQVPLAPPQISGNFGIVLQWADEEREAHLAHLLPFQREDFDGLFRAMEGLPVTIRLLDPPLHEFLPDLVTVSVQLERMKCTGAGAEDIAAQEELVAKVKELHEMNPMLGTRGCRLGIQWPEIYAMQVRAIMEAACDVLRDTGHTPQVEIMIPLVGFWAELKAMRELTEATAEAVLEERAVDIPYKVGTMIELPRAAVTADEIAKYADFFSFGTNDLTQTTLGFSRDDAEGKFLTYYLKTDMLKDNPFQKLDQDGVGPLVAMAAEKSRAVNPDIKLGICGEHGGEPSSIAFCHRVGLTYVSCSPFRVPVARLAAAQAALNLGDGPSVNA